MAFPRPSYTTLQSYPGLPPQGPLHPHNISPRKGPPGRSKTFDGSVCPPPLGSFPQPPTTTTTTTTIGIHPQPPTTRFGGRDLPSQNFQHQKQRSASQGAISRRQLPNIDTTSLPFRPLPYSASTSAISPDHRNFSLPVNRMVSPIQTHFPTDQHIPISPRKDSLPHGGDRAPIQPVSSHGDPRELTGQLAPPEAEDQSRNKHESLFEIFSAYEESANEQAAMAYSRPSLQPQPRLNHYNANKSVPATIDEDLPNFDAVTPHAVLNSFFDPQLEAAQRLRKCGSSNTGSRSHSPQIDSALQSPSESAHTPPVQPGNPPIHRYQSLPNIIQTSRTPSQSNSHNPLPTDLPRASSTAPHPSYPGYGSTNDPNLVYSGHRDPKVENGASWAQSTLPPISPVHQPHHEDASSYVDSQADNSTARSSVWSDAPPPLRASSTAAVPIRPGLFEQPPRVQGTRNFSGGSNATDPGVVYNPNQSSPPNMPGRSRTPVPSRHSMPAMPATELDRLRATIRANPGDHVIALCLVKSLASAAQAVLKVHPGLTENQAMKQSEMLNTEGYDLAKRLISQSYTPAMFYLADCYGKGGVLGVEANPREAFSLYQSAAKHGHGPSAYRTAVCCEIGADAGGGTRRDPLKAVQWYRRAAVLGEAAAMYKLGMILLHGYLGHTPDEGEGVNWLKRASERADKENPHALHELAKLYESPRPPPSKIICDERYALELYTDAAKLGYKFSQLRLGQIYQRAELGVELSDEQSIIWYTRAAAQGEHESELALSGWYLIGSPGLVEQNDSEAYLWAQRAAMADPPVVNALFAMGYYSERGIGCPPDLTEAKFWYSKAAALKDQKAINRLQEWSLKQPPPQRQPTQQSAAGSKMKKSSPPSSLSSRNGREKLKRTGTAKDGPSGTSSSSSSGGKKGECAVM